VFYSYPVHPPTATSVIYGVLFINMFTNTVCGVQKEFAFHD